MLTQNDEETLRELGKRYMETASLPVQQEKVAMWKALNAGNMPRPMVLIDQLPWSELSADESLRLRVEDPFWRDIERQMRQTLYKWARFPVDMVVEPFVLIPKAVAGQNYGVAIREERAVTDARNDVVSHRYENQFCTEEDIEKILDMRITHDEAATAQRLEAAQEMFAGIIPVRLQGIQFHLGMWDALSQWMGVESIYLDLLDRPEFMHKLMRRITDATVAGIEAANELGLHDDIAGVCHCSHTYTDALLPGPGEGRGPHSGNSWAYGMAQLFSSVSPDMTRDFELPYIQELAGHFACIYYGCCDRLDDRLELIKRIPNLRKVSCSPWSDRDAFAEKIGPKLVMSAKPSPALVAGTSLDHDAVEKDLRHTVDAARRNQVNLELILKDVSTVRHKPERLAEWARVAMRAAME